MTAEADEKFLRGVEGLCGTNKAASCNVRQFFAEHMSAIGEVSEAARSQALRRISYESPTYRQPDVIEALIHSGVDYVARHHGLVAAAKAGDESNAELFLKSGVSREAVEQAIAIIDPQYGTHGNPSNFHLPKDKAAILRKLEQARDQLEQAGERSTPSTLAPPARTRAGIGLDGVRITMLGHNTIRVAARNPVTATEIANEVVVNYNQTPGITTTLDRVAEPANALDLRVESVGDFQRLRAAAVAVQDRTFPSGGAAAGGDSPSWAQPRNDRKTAK